MQPAFQNGYRTADPGVGRAAQPAWLHLCCEIRVLPGERDCGDVTPLERKEGDMAQRVILMVTALLVVAGVGVGWAAADEKAEQPNFAGVYTADNIQLTLAGHPHRPRFQYIGVLVQRRDDKIQPVEFSYNPIKGCHGLVYDGKREKASAVELKLEGQTLTFRWYDGPTWKLKREKGPDSKE
jgi:hypothetical protein